MNSAEGQVQNLRYRATFPLLINVANQPTYFMALKDDAGLVKKFAMVDIQRYQNVAVGDTVAQTQQTYEALLATNGVDTTGGVVALTENAEGTIDHIAQAVIDGNTHFYIKLKGDEAIYDFALPGLIDIVGFGEGDDIQFNYLPTDANITPVESLGGPKEVTTEDANPEGESGESGEANAEDAIEDSESAVGSGTVEGPEDAEGEPDVNSAS